MATGRAALAAGIPLVNTDEGAPVPGGFVLQLAYELTPADIVNRLCQRRMLRHRLHVQTLHANRLVLTNDAGGKIVQEIGAPVGNACMDAGHLPAAFVPVLGSAFLFRETALRF